MNAQTRSGTRAASPRRSRHRHPLLGDELVERLALDQLHREEVNAVGLLDRVDADDTGVVERGERLRLPPEALEPLRARRITHPRVFREPTPLEHALAFAGEACDRPNAVVLAPCPRHREIFTRYRRECGIRGSMVTAAWAR